MEETLPSQEPPAPAEKVMSPQERSEHRALCTSYFHGCFLQMKSFNALFHNSDGTLEIVLNRAVPTVAEDEWLVRTILQDIDSTKYRITIVLAAKDGTVIE